MALELLNRLEVVDICTHGANLMTSGLRARHLDARERATHNPEVRGVETKRRTQEGREPRQHQQQLVFDGVRLIYCAGMVWRQSIQTC